MPNLRYLLFLITVCTFSFSNAQIPNDDRVLLQGFYWEAAANNPDNWYNVINSLAADIGDMGVDMIWLPPPSDAGSLEGYLPRELNNFANNYGSLQDHISMLSSLNNNGVEPIADIVINHRVGNTNWVDFENPQWNTDAITSNDEVWSQPAYFNTYPRGANDTGTPYEAARDIDHTKNYVRESIKQFLNNLKAIGYKGWRYDFVHGFTPSYFTEYNNATNPTYTVGENFNSNKQVVQDWIDASQSNAFDFPTYFTLKSVVRDNNYSYLANNDQASGGIGWDPRNYTTFVENHDTPRYDTPNNVLNAGNVGQTYAYLLTHPGVPCIYWPHLFDWGETVQNQIKELINARKEAGIHSQSSLDIVTAQQGLYAATIQGDNYKVAMKMGPQDWSPQGANWEIITSGPNYAVWKEGTSQPPSNFTVYAYNLNTAYTWNEQQQATSGNWPGATMASDGDGWYKTEVPADCTNIIFSNNGNGQTEDLIACASQPYYYEGQFYATKPDNNSGQLTLYTQNKTHAYTWENNQPTSGQWPGVAMQSIGNGWYQTTLNGNDCTNIIFSNAGADQTTDLFGCASAPYYYNNQWNTSPPSDFSSTQRSSTSNMEAVLIYDQKTRSSRAIIQLLDNENDVSIFATNSSGRSSKVYQSKLSKGRHEIQLTLNKMKPDVYVILFDINGNKSISKLIKN
ncbi:starch-binding protein [Spongiivirga citrea]|uniref:Starch-binding protein n=1 Tax=Spongiivirga citrea TaxID=1481457 RepID=A0A6M0CXU7_9FLAO|nr:starch-binding protein [Spongiivirga citrea]NER18510.1 starch-binding protein [Spongiivirga citrea]